ncbi:uncharacterized protein LOC126734872 isoform X2 [Anthonomus grandis grandis]|uniref:uncharacterized protein LOC126734872 isoform X2 n=1 Tax=Anthonomus grandis grandis TaxID=2921223 RepID=UPI0021660375|nr:uncharacterized protein LOC126734872 isoform X2 [Anthonomus grandis grandis]
MSKRFRDKNDHLRNGKKAKLEEEDFWEDELDEDAIDKAFEIATQQEVNIQNDVTYNTFKNPNGFACSTQAHIISTTTKSFSIKELELEVKKLRQENLEKEGEISVLRSKIKQSTNVVHLEQQKTTNEWREKLHATEKEVKAVKSELEFKNLEIVNLKQQLSAKQNMVKKINLETSINNTQQLAAQDLILRENFAGPSGYQKSIENKIKPIQRRKPIIEPIYALKSISPSSFICTPEDCHIIKSHSYRINRRNTIPYLQNQQNYNEDTFHHKCSKFNNKRITLENIYPEILTLVHTSSQEMNCESSSESVVKVFCVGLILLKDFMGYLEEYGSHLRTEDIQQADVNYVIQDVNGQLGTVSRQLGMEQSKIIEILSILLSCNRRIADFVCRDKLLKLPPKLKKYAILIPHRNGAVQNNFYFLNLVHGILQNIGKYRLTKQCSCFIKTIIKLLQNITNLETEIDMGVIARNNDLNNKIFKSIVFSRPDFDVIEQLSFILKSASQSKSLLNFLFNKHTEYELLKTGPKGVLNFNEDVCTFCVLTLLLENYINKSPKVPIQVCSNMLSFIYRTFKISHWIHHEMSQKVCSRGCSCVSQLYKLEIDLVYKEFSEFLREQVYKEDWTTFLKYEFVERVLYQMSFNNLELVEKYVMVFSHFKEIANSLENEVTNMQLNSREEPLKISPASFRKDF